MSTEPNVTNVFTSANAAERYAKGRPSLHHHILAAARPNFSPPPPFAHALDVACGTGHSTVALLDLAGRVTGVDQSAAMLDLAPRLAALDYVVGRAEALPFGNQAFDFVSIASAFHWVEQPRFLQEAARVLAPGGQLMIYNAGSTGELDHPGWRRWFDDIFYRRFPKVARHDNRATTEDAGAAGFSLVAEQAFPHEQSHTLDGYVELLMTRSNLIHAIDSGRLTEGEARAWIRDGLAGFFPSDTPVALRHRGGWQVLRRDDGALVPTGS